MNRDQRTFRKEYRQKLEHTEFSEEILDSIAKTNSEGGKQSSPMLKTAWQTPLLQSDAGNVSISDRNSSQDFLSNHQSISFILFFFSFISKRGVAGEGMCLSVCLCLP